MKTTIGPDGILFADFEATIVLMAKEIPVEFPNTTKSTAEDGFGTVAMYFLSPKYKQCDGAILREKIEKQPVEMESAKVRRTRHMQMLAS